MLGLGCAGCGGDCGMGEIAGLGNANTLDMSGTFWTQQPNQYPQMAGQGTDPGGISAGNTWTDVFQGGLKTAFSIANSRYGGVQPGQYMQAGSNIAYRLPTGASSFNTFPTGIGVGASSGDLLTWAIIGGGLLLAVKAFSK
jgi:hypothetical protein